MSAKIKLGICQWCLPVEGPYGVKLAAELGFDGIQLNIGTHQKGFLLSKQVVKEAYLELGAEFGIEFPSIVTTELDNYSMVAAEDSKEYQIAMMSITKAIDAAAAMEIPMVMIPSFARSDIRSEEAFARAVEVLKYSCDYAQERGVKIGTESLLSVERLLKLLAEVDRPNLELYFDTQNHYLREGYSIPQMLRELLPNLYPEIHVKDGKDGDLSGALLGEGDTDFYKSMEVLKENNYSGWLISENYYNQRPLSLESDDPVELIRQDIETLKKVFNLN
ncbi:sugar phosphate isomerase/epimerase family protein [Fuchsiella alkaliacetigena]|uniref:sugar phosphate isomerase/epimerase family protein n=1 Tax=Fuchsiella alkaliacetigena TaxID=957042 RepID=UPI00200A2C1A|nr:sugar phosphate isomerase/epimerase family protein [Fuchsiella alkaliacetigena]MCK8824215.1 sugar phosphate isomerase/epimerase [Fuchsiella alkaliacetigena]